MMPDEEIEVEIETTGTESNYNTGPVENAEAPRVDETEDLGAAYDRMMEGQARDEQGRFVEQTELAADGAPTPDQPQQQAPGVDGANVAQEPATVPDNLPNALKAHWTTVPETARGAISQYIAEQDRRFGEIGNQYREVKPIADRLAEVRRTHPEFANISSEQMAKSAAELAAVQVRLERDPINTLFQVMNAYGVTEQIAAVMRGQAQPQDFQGVNQLQQTIHSLQQKIDQLSNPELIDDRVQKTMAQREAETLVTQLSKDKPLYAEVETLLPQFIELAWEKLGDYADKKSVFDLAYDMATNADPAIRAKLQATHAKAPVATPDPKRTEQARKAASINVKSSSNGSGPVLSETEMLGAAFDRAMAN